MSDSQPPETHKQHGEMHRIDTTRNTGENLARRDTELYIALGLFLTALGIPVMIGTFFALDYENYHPAVVNMICGMVLTGIGVTGILYGLARRRNAAR